MFLETAKSDSALQSKISALAEDPEAIVLLGKEAGFLFGINDLADISSLNDPNDLTDEQLNDVSAGGRSAYGGSNGRLYRTTNSNNGAGGRGLGQFLSKMFGG